jgi:hypothetical protein
MHGEVERQSCVCHWHGGLLGVECGRGCSPRRLHDKTPVGLANIVLSAAAMRSYPTRQVSYVICSHLPQKLV